MKRKYRIKKLVRSTEFSKLSGVDSFEVDGGTQCHIVRSLTTKGMPSSKYAYFLFIGNLSLNSDIRVKTTCGVKNCVKKEHLVAEYFPNKKDKEYIDMYYKLDGIEQLAHVFVVPVDLLEKYLAKKK
jgi:hypothetical protein